MNAALKWKLITGFLLVFIAGGVTGAFLAASISRHYLFGPPQHGWIARQMRERMRVQLQLTPEQMKKIGPIIDKSAAQLEQIRAESAQRVHETFSEAHEEIAPNLTDQQQKHFDQMRHRHQQWLRRHQHSPGPNASESISP
jgi:gas vesicle protein